jgi:hypothetical protein
MDFSDYKNITNSKNVLNYKILHDTIHFLENRTDLNDYVLETINVGRIGKPLKHNNKEDVFTGYYYINIPNDILLEIFDALTEQIMFSEDDNIQKAGILIDDLAEKWRQLIDFDKINYNELNKA